MQQAHRCHVHNLREVQSDAGSLLSAPVPASWPAHVCMYSAVTRELESARACSVRWATFARSSSTSSPSSSSRSHAAGTPLNRPSMPACEPKPTPSAPPPAGLAGAAPAGSSRAVSWCRRALAAAAHGDREAARVDLRRAPAACFHCALRCLLSLGDTALRRQRNM